MDSKKQKMLLEVLISSSDTFAICNNIIKPIYFDPEFRNAVQFIKEYFDEYHTTPGTNQIEAESGLKLETYEVKADEIKYCTNEIERFCKYGAMKKAVTDSVALIAQEKYSEVETLIKEAVLTSLRKELGLRYFETVEDRLERMLKDDPTFPTGWDDVDAALFGGISRKELLLVSANSGGGKSITLANLAFNFIVAGKNVLYVSLELSQDIVAQRFDTMFTGIGRKNWQDHADEISKRVIIEASKEKTAILDIVNMPSATNSNQIRAYLKEFYLHYEMVPDLIIVDYLDKMAPNEYVSADNVFEKDKRSSEQLRDIAVDYNMYAATASQLGRSAVGATEHNHSHIAGGISKIHEADIYWSIIMTDEMKARGKVIFIFQKTRNSDGSGTHVHLKWDAKYLRIVNPDASPDSLILNTKEDKESDTNIEEGGNKLTSLLSSL